MNRLHLHTQTVSVESINDYPAVRMTWARIVNEQDVRAAFQQITQLLDESDSPLYVLVDITVNPNFPLITTIIGALQGPHNSPKLAEWLVVGKSLGTDNRWRAYDPVKTYDYPLARQ